MFALKGLESLKEIINHNQSNSKGGEGKRAGNKKGKKGATPKGSQSQSLSRKKEYKGRKPKDADLKTPQNGKMRTLLSYFTPLSGDASHTNSLKRMNSQSPDETPLKIQKVNSTPFKVIRTQDKEIILLDDEPEDIPNTTSNDSLVLNSSSPIVPDALSQFQFSQSQETETQKDDIHIIEKETDQHTLPSLDLSDLVTKSAVEDSQSTQVESSSIFQTPTVPVEELQVKPVPVISFEESGKGENEMEDEDEIENISRAGPVSYYLRNFLLIVNTVLEKDAHLFYDNEMQILNTFKNSPESCQRLFVRLFYRKGPWFKVEKLHYDEIEDIPKVIETLESYAFIVRFKEPKGQNLHINELLQMINLLRNEQLKQFIKLSTVTSRTENINDTINRADLFNMAKKALSDNKQKTLDGSYASVSIFCKFLGDCIKIGSETSSLFRRIHRLFFLNRSEDAEVMLLVDFGHLKYPTYFYLNNHQKPTNQKPKQKELIKYEDYDSEADTIVSEELPPISTKRALITIDLSDSEDTVVDNVASVPQKPQEPCLVRSGTLSKESITTMNMAKLKPKSVFPNREALEKYECALSLAEQFTEIVAQNSGDNGKKYVLSVEIMDQLNTITQTFKQDLKTLGIKYKEKIYENEKAKVELPDYQKLTGMELFLKRFSAGYVIASVLIVGISLLEKCRCYPKAIDLCLLLLHSPYIIHRRGHVWQRLVVDLIHSKKKSRAIKLLKVALSDMTLSKHIRYALQIKLVSLWKPPLRLGAFPKDLLVLGELREAPAVYIRGTSIIKTVGKKSVFVGYNDQSCSVEELALQFYKASDGWSGIHCEGSPFLTIFGLIFWEIIYDASIPHVFQTPYQTSPLDFGTESFYLSRKDAIENVLSMIRSDEPLSSSSVVTTSSQASPIIPSQSVTPSPEYPATITTDLLTQSYNNYRGIQSRFVDWDKCLPLSFLCNLCCCIGGNVLSVILRVMAKEASISGMPDLILYKEKERISKFVEVKGPRDRLSDKQRVWIDTLLEAGADVQVLHVTDKDKQDCKDDDIDFSDL